jgi:hypothetical protein
VLLSSLHKRPCSNCRPERNVGEAHDTKRAFFSCASRAVQPVRQRASSQRAFAASCALERCISNVTRVPSVHRKAMMQTDPNRKLTPTQHVGQLGTMFSIAHIATQALWTQPRKNQCAVASTESAQGFEVPIRSTDHRG